MVAKLDGEDLGVDRGGVDHSSVDEADGLLVVAGLDHPAEEPVPGAHADQAVEGNGVAGVGRRLVVGPRAAPGAPPGTPSGLSRRTITSE